MCSTSECNSIMDEGEPLRQMMMRRTGFLINQLNGQRISLAPNYDHLPIPTKGCEIFVGRLPRNLYEDELIPHFSAIGDVYKVRLMVDFKHGNRGFGFVTYSKPEYASLAVSLLNNSEIRPGAFIGVYKSVDNCRLFVGGIPTHVSKEEVRRELEQLADGIKEVIMYSNVFDKQSNRGYIFIEFIDHRTAAMARRKFTPGSLVLWGVPILVDWADPLPDADPKVMSKVTKLYLRNLASNVSNEALLDALGELFDTRLVTRVHKMHDYAFVHFANRQAAEKALQLLKNAQLFGNAIDVTWARPRMYSKHVRHQQPPDHLCTSLPPRLRRQVRTIKDNLNLHNAKVMISSAFAKLNVNDSDTIDTPTTSASSPDQDQELRLAAIYIKNNDFALYNNFSDSFARL